MRSPSASPFVDDAQPVHARAELDACAAAPCCPAPTTPTEYVPCTEMSAFSGTTTTSLPCVLRGECARARTAPGRRTPSGFGHERLQLDRAGARVDLAVHGDDRRRDAGTRCRPTSTSSTPGSPPSARPLRRASANCFFAHARSRSSRLLEAIGVPHVVDLAQREVHADRIDLRDRREQRRAVLADEVADAHEREPGDAVDRRANLRVREVQRSPARAAPRRACTCAVGVGDARPSTLSRSCCETMPVLKRPW